ncbi:hypothetical protein F4677DRAFT_21845 [Hypoxylon crocopeplum]|nr:hypothetical protein F4677DRAFT_21845 [Hypoxylon crocopeplum]
MQVTSLLTSTVAFAGLALAAPATVPAALVVVEASHGGAGSGLTNTTLSVPIGTIYNYRGPLDTVSTLYLVGTTEGVPVDSVTCTPYHSTDGTGSHGLPFTYGTPSRLSTNTVVVGSVVCETA